MDKFSFGIKTNVEMETKLVFRHSGKKWTLPLVLPCGIGHRFYEIVDYREPKKGEYYISGAIPKLYKAPNNLSQKYLVAIPGRKATLRHVWQ